jgi:hypothetical protein
MGEPEPGGARLEELTRLVMAAQPGVQATRWSLARADRRSGRRNLWLRALDAAGMGYDS